MGAHVGHLRIVDAQVLHLAVKVHGRDLLSIDKSNGVLVPIEQNGPRSEEFTQNESAQGETNGDDN